MDAIYLDHNSTTPVLPEVIEAMMPFWRERFGNPASAHGTGRKARRALEDAREQVAALLDADPKDVIFTSGATEANNLAIFGLCGEPPGQVIASAIEHPSVAEPVAHLQTRGFQVEWLPVDSSGVVVVELFRPVVRSESRLVAVMLANNEVGSIQPIGDLVAKCREHGPQSLRFHCDATQAVAKVPVSFRKLGVDTLSFSAHKFNGPKGAGALLLRQGTRLRPLFFGGHQQQGQRPGTEAPVLAVGLAKALEIACREMEQRLARVTSLRGGFLELLHKSCEPIVLNGPAQGGLPHTVNVSFPGCGADVLLMKLDLAGVACSTGSACSSGSLLPSPVLKAMSCPQEVLHSAMRFSLSHLNTETEIAAAAERIAVAVRQARAAGISIESPGRC
jgi:cysteine desulfurase